MLEVNIDSRINWVDFYSKYVKKPRTCGTDKMHACCPFHSERHPSFWFNTKNGCFKCEGCGESGNATVFLSKIEGIDNAEAYKELLKIAGIDPEQQKKKKPTPLPAYDVAIYSQEKFLMEEWLKDECGIVASKDRAGQFIKIPYKDEHGTIQATRKRYHPDNPNGKFKWQKGSKLCLYGLWKRDDCTDYAILVEGESDSQSLWMLGLPALGVPGATNFQTAWVEKLKSIPKIYLHIEPDKGGQTFRQQVTGKLKAGGYEGSVYAFTLNNLGVKDPSELYQKNGMDALEQVKSAMQNAEPVNLDTEEKDDLEEIIPGMPVRLAAPEGWQLSDDGIFKYDARTEQYKRICRTPIIIVKRLRNIETDEEKVQIAFKKGKSWRYGIFNSTTIYQSRNIVSLADLGALITSENAKQVVSFLEALESENINRIQEVRSVSQLGWADDKHFIPGYSGDIVLDVERSMYGRVHAYNTAGNLEDWKEKMRPHRQRNRFRFLLAAAFAPPILKMVNQRIFFVYNWGGSEGGKTAALHAALSVWGDPESLKVSFNATKVGLERTAAFYKDLPFGLNERQLAGTKQESVEQLVYMLAEGGSKVRGTKNGGLQVVNQWRTVIIANGEEPLSNDSTQTGVSTRVLEVYGAPFDNPQDASEIYPFTAENHGTAGQEFIRRLIDDGGETVKAINKVIQSTVRRLANGRSGSHIDGVATVATADALVSEWLFGESREEAIAKAVSMATEILLQQQTAKSRDVNENALQFTVDWILSNYQHFKDGLAPNYGFLQQGKCYIYPSIFNDALSRQNFSPRKTLKFLHEKGVISKDANGKYSLVKYDGSKNGRFVEFDIRRGLQLTDGTPEQLQNIDLLDFNDDEQLPF